MKSTIFLILLLAFPLYGLSQSWDWVDRVQGPGNNYVFTVKSDDSQGNIYSTGRVKSNGNFGEISTPVSTVVYGDRDVFLTKHDLDGNLIWVKRFGGLNTDYGSSVEITNDYVIVLGFFSDTVIIDNSDTLISNGLQDLFIVKFDKLGNFIDSKTFGGPGNDQIDASEIDGNGNIIIAGSFEDSINFDGVNLVNTINSTTYPNTKAAFIGKINDDFNVVWAKKQQSTLYVVHTDLIERDGFIYISGYYTGVCQFYPGITLTFISSFFQASLMKITNNGEFVWVKSFGGNYSDIIASIDFDENNFLYGGGTYKGTATYQTEILSSPSNYLDNGMIVKFDTSGTVVDSYQFPCTANGRVESICVVEDKVYAAGYFSDSLFILNDTIYGAGLYDMVIFGLDTSLNLNWHTEQGGTSYDQIRNIDVSSNHNIAFGGSIKNAITFPTITFTTIANTYDGVMGIVTPPLEARLIENDTLFCSNQPVTIYNNSIGKYDNVVWNASGLNVIFSDNDSIIFTSTSAGNFSISLVVSNLSEIDSVVSSTYVFQENSLVDLGIDSVQSCQGDVVTLTASGLYNELTWNTGATSTSIDVTATNWYYCTVSFNGNCSSYDSVFCDLNTLYPTVNINDDSTFVCENSSIQIDANGIFENILWSNNSSLNSILVDSTGWYYVNVNNNNLCYSNDSVFVSFSLTLPTLIIEATDTVFCAGEQIVLTASGIFSNLMWNTGETGNSINTNSSGIYFATALTNDGCEFIDSIEVIQVNCLSTETFEHSTFVNLKLNNHLINLNVPLSNPIEFRFFTIGGDLINYGLIENNQIEFNNELSTGLYFIVIDGVWATKIIVIE